MPLFVLMVVWVGVWLYSPTYFDVGMGLGMTLGMLIQWVHTKKKPPAIKPRAS